MFTYEFFYLKNSLHILMWLFLRNCCLGLSFVDIMNLDGQQLVINGQSYVGERYEGYIHVFFVTFAMTSRAHLPK